jgi:hypothetical protein
MSSPKSTHKSRKDNFVNYSTELLYFVSHNLLVLSVLLLATLNSSSAIGTLVATNTLLKPHLEHKNSKRSNKKINEFGSYVSQISTGTKTIGEF